jgi:cyclase|tara:strand:- start:42 stop:800 length:759 start_codon:yes stop_codon:yes gene_type:complete
MKKIRVLARIDVKNEFVIKGIHLEGLRKVGNPNKLALDYYNNGIDEIIFMDAVAAYYDRNTLSDLIERACADVFIPITVGGGIRTTEDIKNALKSGADKVAINTKAVQDPDFITRSSKIFGSQCIVSSIEAKLVGQNKWEVYTDNGREPSGKDVIEWVKSVQELGAGEIMLTSIDHEGTKRGFDINLYKHVAKNVSIPIIASGGMGEACDAANLILGSNVDAIAIASILHYQIDSIQNIKNTLIDNNIKVRI